MATVGAAAFLRAEREFGRVKEGLRADLLVLPCSPLENVSCLRSAERIVVRGKFEEPSPSSPLP
jgi:cytosine/adenosine deaminase-related metal-dependent hydrolase